jgi:hypothetical protein
VVPVNFYSRPPRSAEVVKSPVAPRRITPSAQPKARRDPIGAAQAGQHQNAALQVAGVANRRHRDIQAHAGRVAVTITAATLLTRMAVDGFR